MGAASRGLVMFTPGHSEVGGAARRSRLLAASFAERGWRVRVVTRAGTLNRPRLIRRPNLVVVEVPGFGARRAGAVLYVVTALVLGVVWGLRAQAFLAIQLVSPTSVASLCSLILRRPFICMATATGSLGELHYARQTRLATLRMTLLRRATFVIAQNPEQAVDLGSVFLPGSVKTLPNPVDLPSVAGLDGRPRALFTGRFSEEKDLIKLMDAWSRVVEHRTDARLTLLGSGGSYRSIESELRAAVASRSALSSSVDLPGWVPDVTPFLLSHDVFVLPSLSEGMSNALLEAAAYGRIIVATDIPGNTAVLGADYPLLVPPGDPVAMAKGIERAFQDDELRERARAQLQTRAKAFSTEAVVGALEALLREAAEA